MSFTQSMTIGGAMGARRRALAPRPVKAALAAPRSSFITIGAWVAFWLLLSVVLCGVAAFWGSTQAAASPRPVLVSAQGPGYDLVRCARVADTWQAAGVAADQYRVTNDPEYQADAERLRNKARADGRLYCNGDPNDR